MRPRFLYGAIGALILIYPLLTIGAPVYQRLGALVLLAAVGASAWKLIGGYAGQVSVGHAVFFGAGAYAALAVYSNFGLPPLAGVPLGALIAVLIAALIGMPTLRLSGHYFSMATIAVAELVRVLITNWDWVGGTGHVGTGRIAHAARSDIHLGASLLLHLSRRLGRPVVAY